jgi:hypothetical protein
MMSDGQGQPTKDGRLPEFELLVTKAKNGNRTGQNHYFYCNLNQI